MLTLRNTSVLFAQLLALWGGEHVNRRSIGGAILVVGGAVLAGALKRRAPSLRLRSESEIRKPQPAGYRRDIERARRL